MTRERGQMSSESTAARQPQSEKRSRPKAAVSLMRVLLVRIRFVFLFVATGAVFAYWDTLENYYDKWTRPEVAESTANSDTEYFCPMCPQIIRDAPATCPICVMPLSKREKVDAEPLPAGVLARVTLSPDRQALAGIRVAEVRYEPLVKMIRTMGFVEVDERRVARIAARVPGRIEKLHVDFTGKRVVRGAPLVDIYSPELYLAAEELLLTSRSASEVRGRRAEASIGSLLEQSREKLLLLGMSEAQIDDILHQGRASYYLTLLAPQAGVVLKKPVVEGQYVQEGSTLYEIADLSQVWIKAQIYEDQLPYVRLGQEMKATCSSHVGQSFSGIVAFIDPVVDRSSRTINVRFDLQNPGLAMRPGMYVEVALEVPVSEIPPFDQRVAVVRKVPQGTDDASLIEFQKICPVTRMELGSMGKPYKVVLADRGVFLCCKGCEGRFHQDPERYLRIVHPPAENGVLAVPCEAVIDTGTRKVVYRESQPGVFEGVEVVLGPPVGDRYPVVSGLNPGDRIAASGAFLVDAETRLNPAASAAYFGASDSRSSSTAHGKSTTVAR